MRHIHHNIYCIPTNTLFICIYNIKRTNNAASIIVIEEGDFMKGEEEILWERGK